jgi:competence protein ComEC
VIRNIGFNFSYLLAFYLVTIAAVFWLKKPSFFKLVFLLFSILMVQLSFIITKNQTENQQELIVFNQKKKTIISERKGKNIQLFTNDNSFKKESNNNITTAYLTGNFGVLKSINKLENTLFFNDRKILLIDSSSVYPKNARPDILILTQSPKLNLDRLIIDLHPKQIICDASNSYSIQKYWKTSCRKKKIPFHATAEKGFYKLN